MKTIGIRGGLNRRELLLLGAATACPTIIGFPTTAHALLIPPPPPSLWYLIFIADGIYKISGFYTVTLPASEGTAQNYNATSVGIAFGSNFSYTQRTAISGWNALLGAPQYRWWEYLDKRNGRYVRMYLGDRIEVKFADKSRVKIIFRGEGANPRFQPLVGTERLPDGTRLYPRTRDDRDGGGGEQKTREGSNTFVTKINPPVSSFNWSYSTQETPW